MHSDKVIFKRLFEIRILHDYFFIGSDGVSFFERSKQEKETILNEKVETGTYDIRNLFDIELLGKTKEILGNSKFIFRKTALGFIVGLEVFEVFTEQEKKYKPRFELDKNLKFGFSIKPNVSFLKSITNLSFKSFGPAIYYFSNKDKQVFSEGGNSNALPISNKPKAFQNGTFYEMGALVQMGNSVKEALQFTKEKKVAYWEKISDKRFVSDADKILLPSIFNYQLKAEQNVTNIKFILIDQEGNEIKTISKISKNPLINVLLNFLHVNENNRNSKTIPEGKYNLKVILNESTEIVRPIYLNDLIYRNDYFGVIEVCLDEDKEPFNILDNQGFLKTKGNSDDENEIHPIFEIRLKNRRTYWRYNSNSGFPSDEIATTATFLDSKDTSELVSKKPKGLTSALVPFINGTSLMLPQPKLTDIKIEKEKIFSEIYINQSNRLLNT